MLRARFLQNEKGWQTEDNLAQQHYVIDRTWTGTTASEDPQQTSTESDRSWCDRPSENETNTRSLVVVRPRSYTVDVSLTQLSPASLCCYARLRNDVEIVKACSK